MNGNTNLQHNYTYRCLKEKRASCRESVSFLHQVLFWSIIERENLAFSQQDATFGVWTHKKDKYLTKPKQSAIDTFYIVGIEVDLYKLFEPNMIAWTKPRE